MPTLPVCDVPALELRRDGFAPIPVAGKAPTVKNWTSLCCRRPTTRRLVGWWGRWPAAGVGVVTGEAANLLVIDVDPRNGGTDTMRRLAADVGTLGEPAVLTGRGDGGAHWYFAMPDGDWPSRFSLGPGIDVMACGSMVVAPPTLHPDTGEPYSWCAGPDRRALAGGWVRLLRHAATRPKATKPTTRTTPSRPLMPLPPELRDRWRIALDAVGIEVDIDRPDWGTVVCPFHDDDSPSLSIAAQAGLCHCHAIGCDQHTDRALLVRDLEHVAGITATGSRRTSCPDALWRPTEHGSTALPCKGRTCPVCGPLVRRAQAAVLIDADLPILTEYRLSGSAGHAPIQTPTRASAPTWKALRRRFERFREAGHAVDYVRVPQADGTTVVLSNAMLPGVSSLDVPDDTARLLDVFTSADPAGRAQTSAGWPRIGDVRL